jgi:hypothetical protein
MRDIARFAAFWQLLAVRDGGGERIVEHAA